MPQQLTGLDSAFLSLETDCAPLHVVMTILLEPRDGRAADHAAIRRRLAPRLSRLPFLRRKLQEVPWNLDHPYWNEASSLDLDRHVHRAVVDPPGSADQLAEIVARLVRRPLDRDRPLWELWVIEGIAGSRTALLAKVHHALVDGVAGVGALAQLLDASPETGDREPPHSLSSGHETASLPRQAWSLASRVLGLPARTARLALETAGAALRIGRTVGLQPSLPTLAAPASCLSGALTPRRTVCFADVSLATLREIRSAFDVKLNDVVLAASAGALRSVLEDRGSLPSEPLKAAVPVAVRRAGDAGNAVSAMRVELPVHLDDAVQRLEQVRRSADQAKRTQRSVGGGVLAGWADLAIPWLVSGLTGLYSRLGLADWHRPLANLVVSNVPGPPRPLYCAGHEVGACYPLGPLYEGWGLNLTLLSYADRVYVGLMACPDLVPDPVSIRDGFESAVSELHAAALSTRRRREAAGRLGTIPVSRPPAAPPTTRAPQRCRRERQDPEAEGSGSRT